MLVLFNYLELIKPLARSCKIEFQGTVCGASFLSTPFPSLKDLKFPQYHLKMGDI